MKKLSILTTPAIALGVGVLCAPQALAVGYTLNQTNVDAAVAAAGHNTEGIFCDDGGGQFCTLNEGDWTQEGNVEMPVIDDTVTPTIRWGLVLQNNVDISNPDGGTFTGDITITADEVTLTDVNATGSVTVQNADAEVTINGGSYATADGGWGGALNVDNAKSVTVNDAAFSAGGASAAYIGAGDIAINGGSFTSEGDNGIEFFGFNSLNITGGTFAGAVAGLAFDGIPDGSTISLSGGTFTGTGADGSAIKVYGTNDTTAISGMLASGYHFTNGTIETDTQPGMGGGDYVYIAGTTTVTDGSSDDGSDSSSSRNAIGAPDTGAYTAEGSNATSSSVLTILATVALATSGVVLAKKYNKRA